MIDAIATELAEIYAAGAWTMALDASFELPNTAAARWARAHAGELVKGLDEVSRRRVAQLVEATLANPDATAAELRDSLKAMFSDWTTERAEMVARTELVNAANKGALKGFRETGGQYVLVSDGFQFDPACADANGAIWSLDYADRHPIEHPNCGRSFDPASDDEVARYSRSIP